MAKSRSAHVISGAIDALEELIWPTRCVGCNLPGILLCDDCRHKLPWIAQRWACSMCGAPFGWLACTECGRTMEGESWPLRSTICGLTFEGPAAAMPALLKDAHELRIARVMAAAMACSLDEASQWLAADHRERFCVDALDMLCFVPATARAFARRGFDHMELVSQALSALIGIPMVDMLMRVQAKDQRELDRRERAANAFGTMKVIGDVVGARVLVVDDVLTTGASLCEAARSLLAAGADSVTGCAFARVWSG